MPRDVQIVRASEYPWGQRAANVMVSTDSREGIHGAPGSEVVPFTTPIRVSVFSPDGEKPLSLSFDITARDDGRPREGIRVSQGERSEVCEAPMSGRARVECLLHVPRGLSVVIVERIAPDGATVSSNVLISSMRVDPAK